MAYSLAWLVVVELAVGIRVLLRAHVPETHETGLDPHPVERESTANVP